MNQTDLESTLQGFTGTSDYHRFNALARNVVLTDGAKFLAENASCYWLMDIIANYQPYLSMEEFQVWTLNVNLEKRSAVVVCDDGNGNILKKQKMLYTDFPMESIKLYVERCDSIVVILLPSEH